MAAALSGVLAYLGCGLLGCVRAPRAFSLLALLAGIASFSLWAPGFAETLVGGLPWGIAVAGDVWAAGVWVLGLVLHAALLLHAWTKDSAFHPLATVLIGACLAGSLSRDLFNLYVLMDLSSLIALVLIASGRRVKAVWAGLQYLVLTEVGLTLYLFGLGLVYARLGTLSVTALAQRGPSLSDPALAVGVGLLLAGAAVKTGVFLLGLWLPQAHGQAPTEASVLLSGIVVKIGVVTLARLSEAFPVGTVLLLLGIVTGFGGLAYALWEKDLKVFLAFHTVSQLGYMLVGLGLGAGMGALLYVVAHGLFKGLLFLAAGEAVDRADRREIAALAGRLSIPVAVGLGVGTCAIAGLPPLVGFAAKGLLAQGAPAWAKGVFYALGLGTAASFSKLVPLFRPRDVGPVGGIPVLVVAVLALGLGATLAVGGLLSLRVWGEAVLIVVMGYGLYFALRRVRPRLPRWGFDWSVVSLLVASVGVAGLVVLGGL
ncbi:MAG: hypothetical protein BIP78_0348 [Candidatus Bipolaricaulis sibiricus]|uniref:NADH:quinone oxidoreductase/Mrp antiporter transmembrane domain-containing protein n=1 Tax=Bipolaricaulis sibiricus TaxID=2501609 RepID=A0A410FT03_BIPS1|nr:MAG: hypothetical protein BIP78_0348 [Candidatus Bipolaricaulis sibiricus]